MDILKASEACANLYRLIDEVAASHHPVLIIAKRHNAVLLSEDDWRAIQETMSLLSISGMRESIVKGSKTPISKCADEIDW